MKRTFYISLILVVGIFLFPNCSYSQKFTKHEMKTAFVHNFIRFVKFPKVKENIIIGVIGKDDFTMIFKAKMLNQKIGLLPIKIVQYSADQNFEECDVLLISKDEELDYEGILRKLKGTGILTIGESNSFFANNGIINFVEGQNGNYFFEINQSVALQEELQISSKLLKLAKKVK